MKSTSRNWLIAIIVLLLLVLGKWQPWRGKTKGELSLAGRMGFTPVRVMVINMRPLENTLTLSGTVLANEAVSLKSEIAGKVTAIHFREGTRVKTGDLLLQINDADLQAQMVRAKLNFQLAQDSESRQRQQLAIEAVSQEAYDTALNRLHTARAEVSLIEAQIAKTRITAPFSGTIGLRQVSEGAYVSAASPIAELVDYDPVKIEFAVPERYAARIRVGDRVRFHIQGQDQMYEAGIYAAEPRINQETRSVTLRARCPNPDGAILPGAFAEVTVPLIRIEETILIPSQSLIPELDKQKVYLVKSGVAVPKFVETGWRSNEEVQIISGLAVGDTLITNGVLLVRPGLPVQIAQVNGSGGVQ